MYTRVFLASSSGTYMNAFSTFEVELLKNKIKNHTWVWTERCSNVSQLVGSFVWWNMMKLHMKSRWNRYDVMVMKMLFRILGLLYGDGQFFVLWCHGDETAMKSWWTAFSDIHQDSLTYWSVLYSTAQKKREIYILISALTFQLCQLRPKLPQLHQLCH